MAKCSAQCSRIRRNPDVKTECAAFELRTPIDSHHLEEMTMSILGRASIETRDVMPNGPNLDSGINGKVFRTVFWNPA